METVALDHVKSELKQIIAYDLDANIDFADIRDDISLFEDGVGLDSITIVNFIVVIENKFNFSFGEDDINARLFSSLNNLAEFISYRVG